MPSGIYYRSPEHLVKMRQTMLSLWENKDFRAKQIKAHLGYKPTEEHRQHLSEAQKGTKKPGAGKYKKSEEHKRKLSEAHKGMKKPWAGKHKHSEETKRRMSEYHKRIGTTPPSMLGWRKKNAISTYDRKLYLNNRRRARKNNAEGSHTQDEWEELKKQYNYMCLCCKRKEPEIKLTEDHVIPLSLSGSDFIDNIQPLCKSCNSIKNKKELRYVA